MAGLFLAFWRCRHCESILRFVGQCWKNGPLALVVSYKPDLPYLRFDNRKKQKLRQNESDTLVDAMGNFFSGAVDAMYIASTTRTLGEDCYVG